VGSTIRASTRLVAGQDPPALELRGGGEHLGVGEPLLPEHLHLLDTLRVVELAHDAGDAPLDLLLDDLVRGEVLERVEADALRPGPHGGHLGVEHHQRRHERLAIADHAGLAHERDHLERRLEVGRADVLPAGGDDQLLLAVDDGEVAVFVDHADVAGVEPAVLVESLRRLLGLLVVALEDVAAPADDLAVVGQLHLAAGNGRTDRAGLHLGGGPRHRATRLGHAVDLRQRDADGPEPGQDLGRDGGGAGDARLELVEADQGPHAAKGDLVEELEGGQVFLGGRAPVHPLDDRRGRGDGVVELVGLLRVGTERGVDAGVDLLPHARNAEHEVGVHLA
jgi:hypothetical protein